MEKSLASRVAAVAVLDEPTRRRLYQHVVDQPMAISRDEAAQALEIPRATAAFHLDRLVSSGLLEVSYERRTGRSGPGAGRPTKLYQRSGQQVGVSIPERRYDLAGALLAAAVAEAEDTGASPRTVLEELSYDTGRQIGSAERTGNHPPADDALLDILRTYGFEPRRARAGVVLANCPFHTLAQEHTALICGMNLALLSGLLAGLPRTELTPRLAPEPGRCCVRLETSAASGGANPAENRPERSDPDVRLRRVYDDAQPDDGARVLIDRIWPRGVRRDNLVHDEWLKDVAPSAELRRWFAHDPSRYSQFARRYRDELTTEPGRAAMDRLRGYVVQGTLTLLTATRDLDHCHAAIVADLLREPR